MTFRHDSSRLCWTGMEIWLIFTVISLHCVKVKESQFNTDKDPSDSHWNSADISCSFPALPVVNLVFPHTPETS